MSSSTLDIAIRWMVSPDMDGAVEKQDYTITITPTQVEAWKKELTELSQKMAADQKRYQLLIQRINAVALYLDPPQNGHHAPSLFIEPQPGRRPIQEMSPKEIIVHWLKRYKQPITVKSLRDCIEESGYP